MMGSLLKSLRGNRVPEETTKEGVLSLMVARRLDEAALAVERLSDQTPRRELVKLCLEGELAFRRYEDDKAEAYFRQALAQAPGFPDAHHGLSLVFHAKGEIKRALSHALFASLTETSARFSAQLGLCQLESGNYRKAKVALMRAARLEPMDKTAWNNLGIVRRAMGNHELAAAAFSRALAIDPGYESARANLETVRREAPGTQAARQKSAYAQEDGDARSDDPRLAPMHDLEDRGEYGAAIRLGEELQRQHPAEGVFVIETARLYGVIDEPQIGIDALDAYLTRVPDNLDVVKALGVNLVAHHEHKRAQPLLQRAILAWPRDIELLLAMADVLYEQGRFAEAGDFVDKAYNLEPTPFVRGQLMASLSARCQYDRALEIMDEMEAADPTVAESLLGFRIDALTYLGRHDDVLARANELIEKRPNDAPSRFARGVIRLLREDYAEGWTDYSYRHLQDSVNLRVFPFEPWQGESLEGKSILIGAEQGLGDQVMFASCIPDVLSQRPSRVVLEVHDRVYKTFARSFPECEVIASRQDRSLAWAADIGQVDYYALIADLPQWFRRSREAFPSHRGYLRTDPARVEHWRAEIRKADPVTRPRIGLSWRGGTESTKQVLRTLDMTQLARLTHGIDASWVCLQYGDVAAALDEARGLGLDMLHWRESIADLDEFAAMVAGLDLVVTVCNTTVHYAGALAVPVWVMAPSVPEWRYGLHSSSMAWYPTSRVYRQQDFREWDGVIDNIRADIKVWCDAK
jgi:tetratricopeptide (TPR) repeat protein